MAIATRKKVMEMVATDRLMIAGTHIGFSGVGHVAKASSGYAFVPLPWNANLLAGDLLADATGAGRLSRLRAG